MKNKSIISLICILFCIILCYSSQTYAYFNKTEYLFLNDVQVGMTELAVLLITDTFTPLTHFKKGDFDIAFSPIYFSVDRLYDSQDPEGGSYADGDGLDGYGFGISLNYAITESLMCYFNYSRIKMKGAITGDHENNYDITDPYATASSLIKTMGHPYRMNGNFSNSTIMIGFGYDLIDGENWSMPILIGKHYYSNTIDMDFEPLPGNRIDPYMHLTSNGTITGWDYGIALSRTIMNTFIITGYILITSNDYSSAPPFEAKITQNAIDAPYDITGNTYSADPSGIAGELLIPGLTVTYISGINNLKISASINGLYSNVSNWYNDTFFHGPKIKSFMLTISYGDNIFGD